MTEIKISLQEKKSLKEFTRRFENAEERISKPENKDIWNYQVWEAERKKQ